MKTENKIVKKSLLFFLMSCFIYLSPFAQTIITGGIVSGTWNSSGSPYLVQGAIMIENGSTLNINPGVKVIFQGSYKFLVLGRLLAIGTSKDSITFTASDTTVGWLGIRFDSTASSNDTSKFYYCTFEYGKANGTSAINDGGALYFNSFSKAIISHSLITNCFANNWGGGIFCKASNPIITNNSITKNLVSIYGGGGIYCENGNPIITNNNIYNNQVLSIGRGGGVCCYNSSGSVIANNTFSKNVTYRGGAVFVSGSSTQIYNNIFLDNSVSAEGSGIACETSDATISNNSFFNNQYGSVIICEGNNPIISNNTIIDNNSVGIRCFINNGSSIPYISNNIIANNNGIGISCAISSPIILNNKISNNNGSGISCLNSNSYISNNLISNNTTVAFGGGISCTNSSPNIINNTITNNLASKGGALYCNVSSSPILKNTIMWGDTATIGNQVYLEDQASKPNFFFCAIQGSYAEFGLNTNVFYLGTYVNNINSNPNFVAPSFGIGIGYDGLNADWSLQALSPCIDAGDPTGIYQLIDIEGNTRVSDGRIDIGAYEFATVGTEENDNNNNNSLNIFPNPSTGKYQIDLIENNINKVEIYDLIGEKILEQNSKEIDLTYYRNGIYIVKVYISNGIITKLIEKQ